MADNESKVEAFDLVVFFAVKITPLGPTPALMKRNEIGSRALQLPGYRVQCSLIGFELKRCLQGCHRRQRGYNPGFARCAGGKKQQGEKTGCRKPAKSPGSPPVNSREYDLHWKSPFVKQG
ncbi:MAG: hypothetical protein QNK41_19405 [Desulfosarcina sp.]|nr:hypothetical protein [Desulfosarcina sp.]